MSSHPIFPMPDRPLVIRHREVPFQAPDSATSAGQTILRRLHNEQFIWLITVDSTGTPHTLPLGFLWDKEQANFLIYSAGEADRDRLGHIRQNPKVGLHFNFDLKEGDSFILTGEAYISTDDPPSDQVAAWGEKYAALFAQMGMSLQHAAEQAPIALRVRPLTMIVTTY